ncbi:Uncharacterized membrane protein [Enhydrobacter aerosaccus]|uniref:Uncharacterized membrane protein n=1 Tax=Enhydrobacter aerosaccus TaxID=225324 RepID=A0A1T4T8P9_9HYPH|nr:DUF2339 domain-containing protein [Enhydrobacter aerosaccus]SKA36753.1 Uncharacterized membrane protein [Enhydrobacter aerosaccus]
MDYVLLILLGLAWALGTPLIAIIALARTSSLRDENRRLAADLAALRRQVGERPVPAAPEAALPAEVGTIEQREQAPELPPPFEPAVPAEVEVEPAPPVSPASIIEEETRLAPPKVGWEQRLGARAFIWVGAVTLALAAVFLVRYSIDEGYLSPEVRVVLAALFGFGLIAGAEKVRPRDDRVAQAMAAAGVAALYGALFAAVALYDMISKVAAGGGAAALTAFAISLSLRHGILVAALAFVGGFVSPAIIGTETPNVPVLFGYLLAIAAGTLAVIRYRGWWVLGWGVLAGAILWTAVWAATTSDGLAWVCAFLVAVAGLFVWATWKRLGENENPPIDVTGLVWIALAITGALLSIVVVRDNGQQSAGWLALAVQGAGTYAFGRWRPRFQYAAALGPLLSLATLVVWWANLSAAGLGWDADRFAWIGLLFGLLYAGGAFALMWNASRPGFWAALSVASALTHFLLCWYVLRSLKTAAPWGLISLGLAVPFLVGAERLARWRASMTGATEALGVLAAGVSFFIAAAIALELNREWITVAYAVEFAAVVAIAAWLDLVAMRRIGWGLLAIVVVRFVLNPEVLEYPLGLTPILNWILWGYGIAIAALVIGWRSLRPSGDQRLLLATEAAIALLIFMLGTLEVRSLFQPTAMRAFDSSFMERATYVVVWGVFALVALWMARWRPDPVVTWTWRLAGGLSIATALVVQVLIANPIFDSADVGRLPIVNGLLIAYALPAAMAAVARRWIDGQSDRAAALLAGAAAGILAFVYVSLEVRHVFDPGFDRPGLEAEGIELYAYSFVWLLFGVALLAFGFARRSAAFRHTGMALVCIVIVKVFLIDLSGLHGLLRVVSFLGLGAALLGLGFVYRRVGFDSNSTNGP